MILNIFSFCCSVICVRLLDLMDCSAGFPVLHHCPELAQTHVHWVGDTTQPSHPLSPPSAPVLNLFQHQGLFQRVSSLHQVAKVLKLCISPSNEYSGLISFRIDWFDLLVLHWALKSFLQHHSSKASTLQHSVFFMVQLAHPYMITEKNITFTIASYPMRKHTATSSEVLKLRSPPQSWQLKSYWWAVGRVWVWW